MTATQQQHRSWRLMAAMRRTARALRYVHDEQVRANAAILRPFGASPSGPPSGTSADGATSVSGHAEAAATRHTHHAA